MNQPTYIQWANENEGRSYPVSETASQQSNLGVAFPQDILVDLGIMVPPGIYNVRLSGCTVTPSLISITIGSDQGALLAGTFLRANTVPYSAYPLVALVPNVSGWVTFGSHQTTGATSYAFGTAHQGLIEPRTIRVIAPPAVTSFQREGAGPDVLATGLVELQVGGGIVAQAGLGNTIVLSLDTAHQPIYAQPCSVQANSDCDVPVIRRINNVPPDTSGKITLRFA